MKLIYTSLRHDNIDRVVELLDSNGIETRIVNRRSFNDADWKRFSYSEKPAESEWPQVWVVHSDDQVRARELLRDIGIDPPTRYADDLALERKQEAQPSAVKHRTVANRMRLVVLALIGVACTLLAVRGCSMAKKPPPPAETIRVTPVG